MAAAVVAKKVDEAEAMPQWRTAVHDEALLLWYSLP
jgi:hypothetical protein